jgi:hypothetical protein
VSANGSLNQGNCAASAAAPEVASSSPDVVLVDQAALDAASETQSHACVMEIAVADLHDQGFSEAFAGNFGTHHGGHDLEIGVLCTKPNVA